MLKKNGGITLIALVITIIVLLILAGVSIAMLSGDNGLLTRSTDAADKEKIAGAKDTISAQVADYAAEWYEAKYVNTPAIATERNAYVVDKISTKYNGKEVEGCTVTVSDTTVTVKVKEAKAGEAAAEGTITDGAITWKWIKVQ